MYGYRHRRTPVVRARKRQWPECLVPYCRYPPPLRLSSQRFQPAARLGSCRSRPNPVPHMHRGSLGPCTFDVPPCTVQVLRAICSWRDAARHGSPSNHLRAGRAPRRRIAQLVGRLLQPSCTSVTWPVVWSPHGRKTQSTTHHAGSDQDLGRSVVP